MIRRRSSPAHIRALSVLSMRAPPRNSSTSGVSMRIAIMGMETKSMDMMVAVVVIMAVVMV